MIDGDADLDCALHKVHHPSVAQLHTVLIDPDSGETMYLCGTGLDNLKVCVAYMKGQGSSPAAKIGRSTWDLAQRVLDTGAVLP